MTHKYLRQLETSTLFCAWGAGTDLQLAGADYHTNLETPQYSAELSKCVLQAMTGCMDSEQLCKLLLAKARKALQDLGFQKLESFVW